MPTMEPSFRRCLDRAGVNDEAISVLEEELVVSSAIFSSLRDEHFEKLIPKLKVGQHALLLKVWESYNSSPEVRLRGYI